MLGFDGGNKLTKDKDAATKDKDAAKDAKKSAAAPSTAAAAASGTAPDGASSSAPAAASTAAPDVMARAKAIMHLSEEERAADAEREAARCAAAASAYEVLLVPRDASHEAIQRAYKAFSMAYHPDRSTAPRAVDVMQAVNAAHQILEDEERRAAYDAGGCSKDAGEDPAAGPVVKVRDTAVGRGAGAAGGIIGAVAGLGLGAAGGALLGAFGGLASSIQRATAYASYTLSASESVALRVSSASAALSSWGAEGEGSVLGVALDAASGALTVTLPPGASPQALLATARALPRPSPARLVDFPPTDDVSFKPSGRLLARLAACAGDDAQDRAFTRKLTCTIAAVAAAQRKELHVPEPPDDDGDGGASEAAGDATALHAGDTYDDAHAAARARHADKPITSMGGMLSHGISEAKEANAAKSAREEVTVLQALGAMFEAHSRGRTPTPEWLARRVAGISLGGASPPPDAPADAAPITDPEQGWGAAVSSGDAADAEWGAAPVAFIEVAVAAPSGRAPATPVAVAKGAAAGTRDSAGFTWLRLGPALPAREGDATVVFSTLPPALLVHLQAPGGGSTRALARTPVAALRVRLVVDYPAGTGPHPTSSAAAAMAKLAPVQVGASVLISDVNWERIAAGGALPAAPTGPRMLD